MEKLQLGGADTRRPRKGVVWRAAMAATAALTIGAMAVPAIAGASTRKSSAPAASYVVSGTSGVRGAITSVGGHVQSRLAANVLTAKLSPPQVRWIKRFHGITVTPNVKVKLLNAPVTSSTSSASGVFPEQSGASQLWAQGDTGAGVNVAVIDTGIDRQQDFSGRLVDGVDLSGGVNPFRDGYGHGTFVAGLIASNGASSNGTFMGEAPGAGLVSVKVAGASGQTTLGQVIAGVYWVIANRAKDNIRVLNMSLGYSPMLSTSLDPLDLAVQAAWNAGIVVVTSAGNSGPSNGTILSPGDDPLVITVGSVDDQGQLNPADDVMSSFSSVGPTSPDGWFKPDLVTSGRSVVSLRAPGSTVDVQNPSARVGPSNFVGTGTSFSAAIVSGAAALVIADHPTDTPNMVKAALLGTASPGPVGNPFVDGHGILDALAAATAPPMNLTQVSSLGPTLPGTTVSLEDTWKVSSWNGLSWNGLSWNGLSWNGLSWNGLSWNGLSWNGLSWNGLSWNSLNPPSAQPTATGLSWNGAAFNGLSWNGLSWNGLSWNGLSWNGLSWNGLSWNGLSWNGLSWNGLSWNGSLWN